VIMVRAIVHNQYYMHVYFVKTVFFLHLSYLWCNLSMETRCYLRSWHTAMQLWSKAMFAPSRRRSYTIAETRANICAVLCLYHASHLLVVVFAPYSDPSSPSFIFPLSLRTTETSFWILIL